MNKKTLTWTAAGLWTALALFLGVFAAVGWQLGLKIYLAPPLTAYSAYLFLTIMLLPALIVFGLCARQEPEGGLGTLLLLLILAGGMLCFFLGLLAPALSEQVQCPVTGPGRVECQCGVGGIFRLGEAESPRPCVVNRWPVVPLMQRVDGN